MALEPKQKIYVKTRSNFDTLLTAGTIGNNHLVFIEDTQEVWTHGTFFSGRAFKSLSDGTTQVASPSTTGIITFHGSGKASVEVGNNGVTITGANATVAAGDSNGQVKIDGQNVSVTGLDSAAFTPATDYATAAQGTLAENAVPNTTTVNGHALSSNVTVTAGDVGLGNVTNESKATMFTDAALTGTPTAPTAAAGTNTTQIATTAFVKAAVDGILGASDAMVFKGTLGTDGTTEFLPNSHQVGDTYKVATAGTYAGHVCEVGDLVICITTGTSANNAHWTSVQTNIDGAVTGPASSTADHIATFDGTSGKVIKDSSFTIATSVPSGAVFTDNSVTAAANHYTPTKDNDSTKSASGATGTSGNTVQVITGIETDGKGHVTGVISGAATDTTYTASDGVSLSNGNFTNSGVRSISTGTTDGTISVNTGGTDAEVAVAGLGSAAFTASTAYATAAQGTLADNAVPSTRTVNGEALSSNITLDGADIAITGYTKASASAALAATDTINAALGKIEYKLDTLTTNTDWAEYN